MKTGKEYREKLFRLLDVIEHHQLHSTEKGLTSISLYLADFDLEIEDFCSILTDIQNEFPEEIEILKLYDPYSVAGDHWDPVPALPGMPEHRPAAILQIKQSCGHLRKMINERTGNKPVVVIEKSRGVYFKHDSERFYPFKFPNGKNKRYELILFLKQPHPVPLGKISKKDKSSPGDVAKTIREINQLAFKGAGIQEFIKSTNSGYQLNQTDYVIELRP